MEIKSFFLEAEVNDWGLIAAKSGCVALVKYLLAKGLVECFNSFWNMESDLEVLINDINGPKRQQVIEILTLISHYIPGFYSGMLEWGCFKTNPLLQTEILLVLTIDYLYTLQEDSDTDFGIISDPRLEQKNLITEDFISEKRKEKYSPIIYQSHLPLNFDELLKLELDTEYYLFHLPVMLHFFLEQAIFESCYRYDSYDRHLYKINVQKNLQILISKLKNYPFEKMQEYFELIPKVASIERLVDLPEEYLKLIPGMDCLMLLEYGFLINGIEKQIFSLRAIANQQTISFQLPVLIKRLLISASYVVGIGAVCVGPILALVFVMNYTPNEKTRSETPWWFYLGVLSICIFPVFFGFIYIMLSKIADACIPLKYYADKKFFSGLDNILQQLKEIRFLDNDELVQFGASSNLAMNAFLDLLGSIFEKISDFQDKQNMSLDECIAKRMNAYDGKITSFFLKKYCYKNTEKRLFAEEIIENAC